MKQAYFLTGTDTEIGKTFVTCALLHKAQTQGLWAAGLKPVAAGTDDAGLNEDVESIRAASNITLPLNLINPYCFKAAIAPHIAAAEENRTIDFQIIKESHRQAAQQLDFMIIEGAGGFRVPLGEDRDTADLAVDLALPVILVVGLRLGCINHALLSVEAITSRGLKLAGWVGNSIDPQMLKREENIATLRQAIHAPLLGVVPYIEGSRPEAAAAYLVLPV